MLGESTEFVTFYHYYILSLLLSRLESFNTSALKIECD